MRARGWPGIIICTLLIGITQGQTKSTPSDRATRSGRKITLHPSEASFIVPTDWLTWHEKFHNNLHLTPNELESVRIATGEWDTEYAAVVNSVMPFQDCFAHVGGDGWGKHGSSFADVQLRVYVTPLSEKQVQESVSSKGLSAGQKFSSQTSLLLTVDVDSWHRTSLRYELFYGDYGGTARVDFFTTTYEGQTFVLAFMYCDTNRFGAVDEVADILHSFRLPIRKP